MGRNARLKESLAHDMRFGFRTLRRDPIFTLVSGVTLALGLGANIAILSLTFSVLFRNLPYQHPEDIHLVFLSADGEQTRTPLSIPTFLDLEKRNRVFDAVGMFRVASHNLSTEGTEPAYVNSLNVSARFPEAIGIEPIIGRSFSPEDDQPGAPPTALIGNNLWRTFFGSDPDIVDRTIQLDGRSFTVVGVLPPGLGKERLGWGTLGDLWLPIGVFYDQLPFDDRARRPGLMAVGRLSKESNIQAMVEDLDRLARELADEHPATEGGRRFQTIPIRKEAIGQQAKTTVLLLQAAVTLVWLIAAANLMGLLVTRFATRQNELATRISLGATSSRLSRQLLAECLLLSLFGGAIGLAIAAIFLEVLPKLSIDLRAGTQMSALDPQLLGITLALSVVTSLLIGCLPVVGTIRAQQKRSPGTSRARISRGQRILQQALVVVELALAFAALTGAGLLTASLSKLQSLDLGFKPRQILCATLLPPQWKWEDEPMWASFFDRAIEQLGNLPGVEDVAITSMLPLFGDDVASLIAAGDRPLPDVAELPLAQYQMVSTGYFQVMGIPLLEGRGFEPGDDDRRSGEPVAIINETLARRFWPDTSPIDKRIAFEFLGNPTQPLPQWRRVIGVVGDARLLTVAAPPREAIFTTYGQRPMWFNQSPQMSLVLKTKSTPETFAGSLRSTLHSIDPQQPLIEIRTMTQVAEEQVKTPRMLALLLSLFAMLALILASVGVYGVISQSVSSRTSEIGIRMALGATRHRILSLVFRQTWINISLGLVLGMIIAFGLRSLAATQVYGLTAAGPKTFFGAAALLALVAILATLAPALRATRIQPANALHRE